MCQPNFFVIGAARSGTTALCEALGQHPEVFMTEPKEPHYFAFRGQRLDFQGPGDEPLINRPAVTQPEAYERLFARAAPAAARGEGSVSYLYYPEAAERIHAHHPDARLICMLRHPADRAYSAYMYMRSRTFEPLTDFRQALDAEEDRVARNWHHIWHYRRMGRYCGQLRRYLERFDRRQVRVYLYDDFRADAAGLLRDCFGFLGVDEGFQPAMRTASTYSGEPRSQFVGRMLMRKNPAKEIIRRVLPAAVKQQVWRRLAMVNMRKQRLDPGLRAELAAEYRDEILRLQDLIDRDLSGWL